MGNNPGNQGIRDYSLRVCPRVLYFSSAFSPRTRDSLVLLLLFVLDFPPRLPSPSRFAVSSCMAACHLATALRVWCASCAFFPRHNLRRLFTFQSLSCRRRRRIHLENKRVRAQKRQKMEPMMIKQRPPCCVVHPEASRGGFYSRVCVACFQNQERERKGSSACRTLVQLKASNNTKKGHDNLVGGEGWCVRH